MRDQIHVGTAGWSYPQGDGKWDGVLYPKGLPDAEKLPYYARYLDSVEVNSTFYRPPSLAMTRAWVARTPAAFRFSIKLYQKFTHPRMYREATGADARVEDEDVCLFKRGLEPIAEAGKLGALLAQLPPSFKDVPSSRVTLESLLNDFREYPLTVELRHRSWTEDQATRDLLTEYGAAWTMIDEPKFKTSVGDVPRTSDLGYFRFHGRNAKEWWRGDRESRYDYLYSDVEQGELQAEIRDVASAAADVFVVYNNHFGAKAIVNALETKVALGGAIAASLPGALVAAYPRLERLSTGIMSEP